MCDDDRRSSVEKIQVVDIIARKQESESTKKSRHGKPKDRNHGYGTPIILLIKTKKAPLSMLVLTSRLYLLHVGQRAIET